VSGNSQFYFHFITRNKDKLHKICLPVSVRVCICICGSASILWIRRPTPCGCVFYVNCAAGSDIRMPINAQKTETARESETETGSEFIAPEIAKGSCYFVIKIWDWLTYCSCEFYNPKLLPALWWFDFGFCLGWAHVTAPLLRRPQPPWFGFGFFMVLHSRQKVVELGLMGPEISLRLWLGVGFNWAQLIARRFNLNLEFDWHSQQSNHFFDSGGVKFQACLWLHSKEVNLILFEMSRDQIEKKFVCTLWRVCFVWIFSKSKVHKWF